VLGDFIEDEESPAPAEAATRNLLREQLEEVLSTLLRAKCASCNCATACWTGNPTRSRKWAGRWGVTRERVRQIEAQALSRLRHPSHRRKLRDYISE